jgi:hypothetical protein
MGMGMGAVHLQLVAAVPAVGAEADYLNESLEHELDHLVRVRV